MHEIFHRDHLRPDWARQAYALARLHDPTLTLHQWTGLVRQWTRGQKRRWGVIGIKDARGYLHALFSYRLDNRLSGGKVLHVSDLIVAHLPGQAIYSAIVKEIMHLARETGCASILVELARRSGKQTESAIRNAFAGAGYASRPLPVFLCERLGIGRSALN